MKKYFFLDVSDTRQYDCGLASCGGNADKWIGEKRFAPFPCREPLEVMRAEVRHRGGLGCYGADFVKELDGDNGDKIFVSFSASSAYFYRRKSSLRDLKPEYDEIYDSEFGYPIGFDVEMIAKTPFCDCPGALFELLSKLQRRREMASNDIFLEISQDENFGAIKAIDWLCGARIVLDDFSQCLRCLSLNEFAWLIAKIQEERGWTAFPRSADDLSRNEATLTCKKQGTTKRLRIIEKICDSWQRRFRKSEITSGEMQFYCVEKDKDFNKFPNIFDADDIKTELSRCPKTQIWLAETLSWLENAESLIRQEQRQILLERCAGEKRQ